MSNITRATRFEIAKILGERASQIEKGSPIFIKPDPNDTIESIARQELIQGRIPFKIKRYLPDGTYTTIHVSSLVFTERWITHQWKIIEDLRNNNAIFMRSISQ